MAEAPKFHSRVIPAALVGLIVAVGIGEWRSYDDSQDECANSRELIADEETKSQLKDRLKKYYRVDMVGVEYTQDGDRYIQILDRSDEVINVLIEHDRTVGHWTAFANVEPCPTTDR